MLNTLVAAGPRVVAGDTTRLLPLNPGSSIGQTFYVPRREFSRFSFQVVALPEARGVLAVTIDRLAAGAGSALPAVRVASIDLRFVTGGVAAVRFSPISDPNGAPYRATITLAQGSAADVALRVNPGSTYAAGALYVDGREQPGDLVFSAGRRDEGMLSTAADLARGRPRLVASPWILLALAVVFCASAGGAVMLAVA